MATETVAVIIHCGVKSCSYISDTPVILSLTLFYTSSVMYLVSHNRNYKDYFTMSGISDDVMMCAKIVTFLVA